LYYCFISNALSLDHAQPDVELRASGILFRKLFLAVKFGKTRKFLECDHRPPTKGGETLPRVLSR
jgi:hypothetical protein